MGWTASTLKARYSEFSELGDSLVDAVLAEAPNECYPRVYGDRYDQAVGLAAAHKLGINPGSVARLDPKAVTDTPHGTTTYGQEWDALAAQSAGGFWSSGMRP